MEQGWHSVESVAERLGLHVRTVRGYIRSGQLKAVRLGKQYRIAQADLDAFTGARAGPIAPPTVEVSAVVEFSNLAPGAADRLSTFLIAGAQLRPIGVQVIHDDSRARLKAILIGGVAGAAALLHMIDSLTQAENDIFLEAKP